MKFVNPWKVWKKFQLFYCDIDRCGSPDHHRLHHHQRHPSSSVLCASELGGGPVEGICWGRLCHLVLIDRCGSMVLVSWCIRPGTDGARRHEFGTHIGGPSTPHLDPHGSYWRRIFLEHSGLGRYGDPMEPFGDVVEMHKVHCLLKVRFQHDQHFHPLCIHAYRREGCCFWPFPSAGTKSFSTLIEYTARYGQLRFCQYTKPVF